MLNLHILDIRKYYFLDLTFHHKTFELKWRIILSRPN